MLWVYGPAGVGKTTVGWALFTQLGREGIAVGYVDIDQLGMCYGPPTPDNWAPEPVSDPGRFLWLYGATAVGKSTVGWQVYQQVRRAGVRAAYVDLGQVGFCQPAPAGDPDNHRLKADNLAVIWQTFHAAGGRCLIVIGSVDTSDAVRLYRDALPWVDITLCRLHALREKIAARVMLRGQGLSPTWGLAGDVLIGQSAGRQRELAELAAAEAAALEHAGIGGLRVDTDEYAGPDIAREILRRTGWPDPRDRVDGRSE